MPRYDFECPHGHRFEHDCLIAERNEKVQCRGMVNSLLSDAELLKHADLIASVERGGELPAYAPIAHTEIGPGISAGTDPAEGPSTTVWVKAVPCILEAKKVEISFADSNLILDHGSASNRDAAREGRYDPLNPNRRFMAKGRGWRK